MKRSNLIKKDFPDRWLEAFRYDGLSEYEEVEIINRETEFTREEDWDIEDALEDYRQFDVSEYIPSWESGEA